MMVKEHSYESILGLGSTGSLASGLVGDGSAVGAGAGQGFPPVDALSFLNAVGYITSSWAPLEIIGVRARDQNEKN